MLKCLILKLKISAQVPNHLIPYVTVSGLVQGAAVYLWTLLIAPQLPDVTYTENLHLLKLVSK